MVTYYLPTYFQGSKGSSPIRSGVLIFCTAICVGMCLGTAKVSVPCSISRSISLPLIPFTVSITDLAPFAIITGQSVERTGHYLFQNYIAWALVMIGYGTLSLLTSTSSLAMTQGLQILGAAGLGVLQVAPVFGVLAPLAVDDNALALALLAYIRSFGQ